MARPSLRPRTDVRRSALRPRPTCPQVECPFRSCRVLRLRHRHERVLPHLIEHDLDGLVELGVSPVGHERRVVDHLDVRIDAVALDAPRPVLVVEREARHAHVTAVDQRRVPRQTDQTAPGPRADERADAPLPEPERERVAARTGGLVDEHALGTVVANPRFRLTFVDLAHGPVAAKVAVEQLDEPLGRPSAAVPALVDDECVHVHLPAELASYVVASARGGVRDVDVPDLAARLLRDVGAVLLDPRTVADVALRPDRLDDNVADAVIDRRLFVDRQRDLHAREALEGGPRVLVRVDRNAVDRKEVVAHADVDAGLAQRTPRVRVPRPALVDLAIPCRRRGRARSRSRACRPRRSLAFRRCRLPCSRRGRR